MEFIDSLRSALSNPSLAYVLLMLSILGVSVEILTPGLIFPSTFGIIAGLFAFIALSTLPVNLFGLILILISLVFFVAEAIVKTKGLITALGLTCMLVGSIILFKGGPANRPDPYLIAGTTIVSSPILIFVANRVASAQHKKIITGREDIVGNSAVARTILNPGGVVFFQGERWKARLDAGSAQPGEELVVKSLNGLELIVSKKGGK
jgi:membrane-bound serine protease (ClpP class)